jgi:hypothetical protein
VSKDLHEAGVTPWLDAGHYGEQVEEIDEALRANGALGIVLIDGSPLERIERSYGVAAHRRAVETLRSLVTDACQQDFGERDVVVSGSSGPDELAILFFRPRNDDRFYRERLPELTRRLVDRLESDGQKIVYPYDRDAPLLPVGHAMVFFNPGLGTERQILVAFDQARRDARLNGDIAQRERHRVFQDLVLAEDIAILYEPIVNLPGSRPRRGHRDPLRADREPHEPRGAGARGAGAGALEERAPLAESPLPARRGDGAGLRARLSMSPHGAAGRTRS